MNDFKEGEEYIMTLKDSNVLDGLDDEEEADFIEPG